MVSKKISNALDGIFNNPASLVEEVNKGTDVKGLTEIINDKLIKQYNDSGMACSTRMIREYFKAKRETKKRKRSTEPTTYGEVLAYIKNLKNLIENSNHNGRSKYARHKGDGSKSRRMKEGNIQIVKKPLITYVYLRRI